MMTSLERVAVSKERAIKALKLQTTDMIPSMEYLTGLSQDNLHRITGIDPKNDFHSSLLRLIEIMEIDIHGPLPRKEKLANDEQDQAEEKKQQGWGMVQGQQVR